jgi:transposase
MARRRSSRKSKTSDSKTRPRRHGFAIHNAPLPKGLKTVSQNAAGIDIGATQHYVAIPEGRDEACVRCFGTFTSDLHAIAEWLTDCGITTIAMESTGVYWIPLFELLESSGFEVKLVEPGKLKRAPGRKTDVLDCQWIQELHTYGLLEGSFLPDQQIGVLRCYMRQRDTLVRYAGQHIQHMQKVLEQMNIKLTEVVSDITGVTGMAIIDAILGGERDPQKLAALRDRRCKNDESTIALALEGNCSEHHLYVLRQVVESYRFYHRQIADVDEMVESHLKTFTDKSDGQKLTYRRRQRKLKNNEPRFDMRKYLHQMIGMDLTEIPGFGGSVLLGIVSEVGLDMSPWPTEKNFASWLCLCPGNHKTGGRQSRGKTATRPTKSRAATLFRLSAQSILRSDCALGAFGRRLRTRLGAPKAITAVAHKLSIIYYNALKYGRQYVDQGAENYERQYRQWAIKGLRRRAEQLGFDLTPTSKAG